MIDSADRKDLPVSRIQTRPFDQILQFLRTEQIDIDTSGRTEFIVGEYIDPHHLQDLVELPFECTLTETNNSVIITVGSDKKAGINPELQRRRFFSRLSGHTHHRYASESQSTFLSGADIYVSSFVSDASALVLVHTSGILQYRKPNLYAYKPSWPHFSGGTLSLYDSWLADHGIASSHEKQEIYPQLRKCLPDLPMQEAQALNRGFAEATNMIVLEASWSDDTGHLSQLMDIINLHN